MTIDSYLRPGARAHLVGIGGISMCSLAEILVHRGLTVTGSDARLSPAIDELRGMGVTVAIGHAAENVAGAEFVVRTAAVHDDNPEIAAARAAGIPVFERAQAFGALMSHYRHAVCVAGTHGKTTTTSMLASVTLAAGVDPSLMIGGVLPLIHSAHRVGQGDTIILEACEYCNSFLSFRPTVAVVLNVDEDHLDFFKDLADISRSFRAFAERVPADGGLVVASADDANTVDCLRGIDRRVVTFGLTPGADVTAADLTYERGMPSFMLVSGGRPLGPVRLLVPGVHNVRNALAAAAAALALDVPFDAIARGLGGYGGAERRLEYHGQLGGALVYDDYAHHPGELHALFDAAAQIKPEGGRVICAFQPHTYTRTYALFDDFVRELSRPDITLLADIYAAREQNTLGISSADLAARIPGAEYTPTLDDVAARLRQLARPGDLILTVGAGELDKVAAALTKTE